MYLPKLLWPKLFNAIKFENQTDEATNMKSTFHF